MLAVGAVVLVVGIGVVVAGRPWTVGTRSCTATVGGTTYRLGVPQAANASTIAEMGKQAGMPDHAVTIALAAALQESQLRNLSHGDRDSRGLFQQRPSQGWGTPSQLTDPRYAAAAFYRALARVPGWAAMSVSDAAQHVQRSNAPDAYARWEPEARVLARLLTGEVPARMVCR